MTAFKRICIGVLAATSVAAVLTLFGMSHGKPAAIGAVVGVLVQMRLRAAASKVRAKLGHRLRSDGIPVTVFR